MTAVRCLGCGATVHDAALCTSCVGALEKVLAEMPAQLADLDVTVTRQSVMGGRGNGGKPTKKSEHPLPYNVHAADVAADVAEKLGAWVLHFCEDEARSTAPASDVQWLLAHIADIQRDEFAGQLLIEVEGWARRIQRAVDRPEERLFAGPCLAEHDNGKCHLDLYAKPGADEIVCDGWRDPASAGCGTVHTLTERREFLRVSIKDQYVEWQHLIDALPLLAGISVNADTAKSWRRRHERDPERSPFRTVVVRGQTLFLGGSVIAWALNDPGKRGPKRRAVAPV